MNSTTITIMLPHNTESSVTSNSSILNNNSIVSEDLSDGCYGATVEEMEWYAKMSFAIDLVLQTILGSLGLIANMIAIIVLCSKNLRGIFTQMLATLSFFDSLFIIFSILEAFRRTFGFSSLYSYLFVYFLYPMHNVILCCSVYIPIALAIERYRAIRHPVEYHSAQVRGDTWRRILIGYVGPVVAVSLIICIPKFFETEVVSTVSLVNSTAGIPENLTQYQVGLAAFRFDPNYVLWYINVTKLVSTGLIPFLALSVLNFKIFKVIQRRKLIGSRLRNPKLAAVKKAAARHSYTLFAICALFLLCHVLRVGLGLHELYVLEHYKRSLGMECNAVKLWTLVAGSVSQLMLTLNSSLNFAIYLLMSPEFRATVVNTIKAKTAALLYVLGLARRGHSGSGTSSGRSSVCGGGPVAHGFRIFGHSPETQTRQFESSMLCTEAEMLPASNSASAQNVNKMPVLLEDEQDSLLPANVDGVDVVLEMDECWNCAITGGRSVSTFGTSQSMSSLDLVTTSCGDLDNYRRGHQGCFPGASGSGLGGRSISCTEELACSTFI